MYKKVCQFTRATNQLSTARRVLVGFSGGPDSVALLHILQRMSEVEGFEIEALMVDHGLRPDSPAESRKAENICHNMGVRCHVKRLESAVPEGASIESWAREKRYQILMEHAETFHFDRIALGHHADDQVETFFIRLFRGSGSRGLGGMKSISRNLLIRPLLCVSREEIHTYLEEHRLNSLKDPSNTDVRFLRNRIRHRLLPYLTRQFPSAGVKNKILQVQELLKRDDHYLSDLARKWIEKHSVVLNSQISLPLTPWRQLPGALRFRTLMGLLSDQDISLTYTKALNIEQHLTKRESGYISLHPAQFLLSIECDTIILAPQPPVLVQPVVLAVPGTTEIGELNVTVMAEIGSSEEVKPKGVGIPYCGDPITVRSRKGGEVIVTPKGERKVKYYLRNMNIPRYRKKHIPMICCGDRVVWIPDIMDPGWNHRDCKLFLRWNPWSNS